IGLMSSPVPGMPLLSLFALGNCLPLTGWILSRVAWEVVQANQTQWAGAHTLNRARERINSVLFLSGVATLVVTLIGQFFEGGPTAQNIAMNSTGHATAASWLVLAICGYILLLVGLPERLMKVTEAGPQRHGQSTDSEVAAH